jgi:uncharacterized protein (TIGR02246 family)
MSSVESTPSSQTTSRTTSSGSGARVAIDAANANFMAVFRASDAAAVADCYTSDAQLLPANSEPVSGKSAIESFWRSVMGMGIASVKLDTVELESQGDLAVEVGRYVLAGADGGALDNGKYVVVWHREAGTWKLYRDIWTTSRPAAGS